MSSRMLAIIALFGIVTGCFAQKLDAVYTSTKSVTCLVADSDGMIWASTRGGVLMRTPSGVWRKFTILDGLPSNEATSIYQADKLVAVSTIDGNACYKDGKWIGNDTTNPTPKLLTGQIASARWKGADYASTAEGLKVKTDNGWKSMPYPPNSTGTHVSALLPKGKVLWAAIYGDGIYSWDGKTWKQVKLDLPKNARDITAMIESENRLWLGTTRDGIWEFDGKHWKQHLKSDEPYDHNCQSLAVFQGNLYMSTLEDGLMVKTQKGWKQVGLPEISAKTPRQMVEFNGFLYVRESIGIVDRFDGKKWEKNVFAELPRKQCSALAVDNDRLYVGQWGGWSEFDGKEWTHHLDVPELQGCQVTALLPDGQRLWVGTQKYGLAEVNRSTSAIKWNNELSGLPDDTVKCLALASDSIFTGSFSMGIAYKKMNDDRWTVMPEINSSQVTDLATDSIGGVYIGARTGLWFVDKDKNIKPIMKGIEVQALKLVGNRLWVGTRTGLMSFDIPG